MQQLHLLSLPPQTYFPTYLPRLSDVLRPKKQYLLGGTKTGPEPQSQTMHAHNTDSQGHRPCGDNSLALGMTQGAHG